jgi:hypothetical protein
VETKKIAFSFRQSETFGLFVAAVDVWQDGFIVEGKTQGGRK